MQNGYKWWLENSFKSLGGPMVVIGDTRLKIVTVAGTYPGSESDFRNCSRVSGTATVWDVPGRAWRPRNRPFGYCQPKREWCARDRARRWHSLPGRGAFGGNAPSAIFLWRVFGKKKDGPGLPWVLGGAITSQLFVRYLAAAHLIFPPPRETSILGTHLFPFANPIHLLLYLTFHDS